MSGHLIPEQRTDKNGVTKRVWVKPSTGSSASHMPFPKLPVPAVEDDDAFLKRSILDYNMMADSTFAMLETATPDEKATIAATLREHGETYMESLTHSAFMGRGAIDIADLALVFEPNTFTKFEGTMRDRMVLQAIRHACEIANCGSGQMPLLWKSPEIIARTKNYVLLNDCMLNVGTKRETKELVELGLGDTGRDPKAVRDVIMNHGISDVEQINFILDGGNPAISDGAL